LFNPQAAHIRVRLQGIDCAVDFTDECNHCGVCADSCFYDVLKKVKRENAE
jgi:ferredoxin